MPVVEALVPVFALSPFSVSVVLKPGLGAPVKSGQDFDLFVNEASESIVLSGFLLSLFCPPSCPAVAGHDDCEAGSVGMNDVNS